MISLDRDYQLTLKGQTLDSILKVFAEASMPWLRSDPVIKEISQQLAMMEAVERNKASALEEGRPQPPSPNAKTGNGQLSQVPLCD